MLTMSYQYKITMLRVTQTKAINQIIPVSKLRKMETSDITERNKSAKKTRLLQLQWVIPWSKIYMDGNYLIITKRL